MNSSDIPVAHTPVGGYGESFPPLVLGCCDEPLVDGAPEHRINRYTERIEQCGNRIVDCGGGTISDARADGTAENAVHDVSVFDFVTPIHVIASYENGVFVLRPIGMPGIEVTRELDANGHMIWKRPDMGDLVATLERVNSASEPD